VRTTRRYVRLYVRAYADCYRWACDAPVARWVMSGLLMPGSRSRKILVALRDGVG